MKVKDLIKQLQEQDPELDVCISSDAEGNSYSLLSDNCLSGVSIYKKDGYNVEIWDVDWTSDDACQDENDWEEMKKTYPKCIIIYP